MATVWFWLAVLILALAFLSVVPGVRDLVRPLIVGAAAGLLALLTFVGEYILWLLKALLRAHRELAKHLMHRNAYFHPSKNINKK